MKILFPALLLALFGDKKESKCSTGEELTSSFVPAGLQVVNHYLSQIREDAEIRRRFPGASVKLGVPTVVVTYGFDESPIETEIREKLTKLGSALDEEADEQNLAECRGVTSEVMRQLEISSRKSARRQLLFILGRIIDGEIKNPNTKDVIKEALAELEDVNSALSNGLNSMTPLKYISDVSVE